MRHAKTIVIGLAAQSPPDGCPVCGGKTMATGMVCSFECDMAVEAVVNFIRQALDQESSR